MRLADVDRRIAYLAALLLHERQMHHYDMTSRLHDPRPGCFGCQVWQMATLDECAEAEQLLAQPWGP